MHTRRATLAHLDPSPVREGNAFARPLMRLLTPFPPRGREYSSVTRSYSGETDCNDGVDNDNNGFVDDCHGYNHADDTARSLRRTIPAAAPTSRTTAPGSTSRRPA